MSGLHARLALTLLFVFAFFAAPSAQPRELALLSVRAWLVGTPAPLAAALPEHAALGTPSITMLPSADGDRMRIERLAAALRERARADGRPEADGPGPVLELRFGDHGFRAVLAGPAGSTRHEVTTLPDRRSLLPALVAIVLSLLTLRVLPSLLLGCVVGAIAFREDLWQGLTHFALVNLYERTLIDTFSFQIIGFVFALFIAVAIMTRSGGIQGLVQRLERHAKGPVRTQLVSFAIGLLVFFDDYTNCLIGGTTMRPLADQNGVSREKLGYIVDSTAAPVAGLSIFSTWVAFEVATFAPQLQEVAGPDGLPYTVDDGYGVFLQTLPYRFYCLFALCLVFLTIVLRREWGPMLTAERRARQEGKPLADDARPLVARSFANVPLQTRRPYRAGDAGWPILALILVTLGAITVHGLFENGVYAVPPGLSWQATIQHVLANGENIRSLLYGSMSAAVLAALFALWRGTLTAPEVIGSVGRAGRGLGFAVSILILAWCLGHTCREDLKTAHWLTAALSQVLDPRMLPATLFLLASTIAFATGTSWGTMAILLPNVVVLAHGLGASSPDLGGVFLMILCIGAVLEGAIFGDHCSPISDTTVLSSVATGGDHLHHVRTQAPYALLAMVAALVCGYLPMTFLPGLHWTLSWSAGALLMVSVLLVLGRNPARRQP